MDESVKASVLGMYRDMAGSEAELGAYATKLEKMWKDCIDNRAFGYLFHYEAVVPALPDLFQKVKLLITGKPASSGSARPCPSSRTGFLIPVMKGLAGTRTTSSCVLLMTG